MKTIIIILALIGILLTGCQVDTQSMNRSFGISTTDEADLAIVGIWSVPSEWIINEKIDEVVFLVKNIGRTRTGFISVCLQAGGMEGPNFHSLIEGTRCQSFDLKPGETVEYHHKAKDVKLPWWHKDNHWVRVVGHIDFDDRFKEGREDNNQRSQHFNYVERGLFPAVQEVR